MQYIYAPFLEHATSNQLLRCLFTRKRIPSISYQPSFPTLPHRVSPETLFSLPFSTSLLQYQLFREKYCIQYIPRRTTSTFIKYKQFHTSRPLLAFTTSHLGFRQVFLRHNENRSVFQQFPVARISSLFMHRSLLAAGRVLVAACQLLHAGGV